MRSGRTDGQLRGEAARVAERVRALFEDGADAPPDHEEPPARTVRVAPGRRPVVALGVVVALVAVVAGWWVLSARPRTMPVDAAAPTVAGAAELGAPSASPTPSSAGVTSSAATEIVVDVAGKVRRPGLYRLPPGSRVDDAITAAGGALPRVDLSGLNLAAKLVDGQQIAVGTPGAGAAAGGAGGSGSGSSSGGGPGGPAAPVSLNTATLEQLETLPGIGPALAQRILDYRTQHGSFASVDQLDDVPGIGTVTFARLKPLVTV